MRKGLLITRANGERTCVGPFEQLPNDKEEFAITEFMAELRRLTITRSGPRQPRVKHSILELKQVPDQKTTIKSEVMLAYGRNMGDGVAKEDDHNQKFEQVVLDAMEREPGSQVDGEATAGGD